MGYGLFRTLVQNFFNLSRESLAGIIGVQGGVVYPNTTRAFT